MSLHAKDGVWVPPTPRPAATMVLVQRGEVLLLRRSQTMAFAPSMHVFPGGGVSATDQETIDPLRACAIRETREEVGITVRECRLIDRWVTPEVEDRRYDVAFFIAHVEQSGRLTTTEADDMLWIAPKRALELHSQGELPMLRPTAVVLSDLLDGNIPGEGESIVAKLPRLRRDGRWDVVNADTGSVLATVDNGPTIAETDGGSLTIGGT